MRLGRDTIGRWAAHWGFAAMVAAAALTGLVVAVTVAVPTDIPGVALQAEPVYRLEVGGAIFVGLYVVATSFVLAVQNRAFTEFGTGGVRARSLRDLPDTLLTQERVLNRLWKSVDQMRDPNDR